MPESLYRWYGARELEAMARRESALSGEIDIARLPRLASLLQSQRGSVSASLRFRQDERGRTTVAVIDLEYDTRVELVCQRCLEAVEYRLEDRVQLAVLENASLEQYLPKEYEPLVLEGERLMPATLVEDEIIISLPLVPRHESGACASPTREARDSV
ncbi:MAG TPA: YceD family protein [Gammaproteobacteria bacterium]|nr:YceD family protein [Gammaproteobacteria bacterium]